MNAQELYQAAYKAQSVGMLETAYHYWTQLGFASDASVAKIQMAVDERKNIRAKAKELGMEMLFTY